MEDLNLNQESFMSKDVASLTLGEKRRLLITMELVRDPRKCQLVKSNQQDNRRIFRPSQNYIVRRYSDDTN